MTNNRTLPIISLLATGGTIAGSSENASDTTGYKPGSISVEDILKSVPPLKDLAQIRAIQVCNIGSEDMTDDIWFSLAKTAQSELDKPEVTGLVITHGTDTMEETAFFLNMVLKTAKPVVLVGSMRPATSISADGPMNLLDAVKAVLSTQAQGCGVLVVLNDEIHAARDVTKTYTTNCATFLSPIFGALGIITGGEVSFYKKSVKLNTLDTEFNIALLENVKALPRVDIIYSHANSDSALIDAAVEAGAKGIVYAGMGNGSIHKDSMPGLLNAAEKGVAVVIASRCTGGKTQIGHQEILDKGFVSSGTLNAQKARILLQLSLLKGLNAKEISRVFETY